MKESVPEKALDVVEHALVAKLKDSRRKKFKYGVPTLWTAPGKAKGKRVNVNPYGYYLNAIRRVKKAIPPRPGPETGGEWSRDAVIYNMMVRTTAAFDHNGTGDLEIPVNSEGFRETGTFLKALAMLPYIKRLGATAVHLLPITSIGHDGNKGTLGSPYAIRNPYELDDNLSEPSLGLDAKTEFKAFVEAAHRLGLRVVVEFVFRTAAKDGDWVKEHPEWFYWIREEVQMRHGNENDEGKYGSPLFTREELDRIHADVHENRCGDLPQPHRQYRELFVPPPRAENLRKEGNRYIGTLDDGRTAKIPGAFADWPPDDNQPPWNDVTYLRMYTHPDFNYIGYNTIRMYDDRLKQPQYVNRPLWDRIVGILPYYQNEFHIDGVMIDMGHALPMDLKHEMVKAARTVNPDFAFWDENFAIAQKSRDEGYNAVFGYLWHEQHIPDRMKYFVHRLSQECLPIPFFASSESHNTHRSANREGGLAYSKWSLLFNTFLPGIPYIHSGYELAEKLPINTGLDFSHEELQRLPSERLPLFSQYAFDWLNKDQFTWDIVQVLALRRRYHRLIVNPDPRTFRPIVADHGGIIAYARVPEGTGKRLAVIGNANWQEEVSSNVRLETTKRQVMDLLTRKLLATKDGTVHVTLKPGQTIVVEY